MIVAHNVSAINTYNKMSISANQTNKSMEKLSSGYKINRASDDAAGLSISEKMRSQIRGLNQASENAEQSISMIQTAEGALNESHSILQRMRELAVQAANDTNAAEDRESLQSEINQLTSEINRIGNTTQYNGMNILDGSKVHITGTEEIEVANGGNITLGANNGVNNQCDLKFSDTLKFDKTASGIPSGLNYSSIKAEEGVNLIKFSKKDNQIYLDMHIESANGNVSLDVNDFKLVQDESGNYTYNNYGISFSLSKESVNEFIKNGSDKSVTTIDLYKVGTMETCPAGKVTGKQIKEYLSQWLATAQDGHEICFWPSFNNGTIYINKTNAKNNVTGKTISHEELISLIPDNEVYTETNAGAGKDFHYHTTNSFLGINIDKTLNPDGFDMSNEYEDDSSMYGSLSNITLTDYETNGVQNRLDYDKADVTFQNASDAYITLKQNLYRKVGGSYYPVTIVNYYESLSVDANGNVTLGANPNLYTNTSGTQLTDAELDDYVEGHVAEAASLTVTFYDKSDVVVKDTIKFDGYGDLDSSKTFNYNANGLSFDVNLREDFASTDKLHAILDFDDKLNTTTTTGSGQEYDNSVYFHVGANTNQVINTEFGDMRANALGLTGTGSNYTDEFTVNNGSDSTNIERGLKISTREGANNAIEIIDKAISAISKERSKYGSIQNRLEYTINNLDTTSENMTNAESTIRDVDMAEEMMDLTKNQILQQASQAMLTQAMQRPQQVLQLLQ